MEISRPAVLLIVIFLAGCTGSDGGEVCTDDAVKLTKTEETALASNTFNYIRQLYLVPRGLDGEVKSMEKFADLYIINFTYGPNETAQQITSVLVTDDGMLLNLRGMENTSVIPDLTQTRATVSIDDDYCLGSEDAPVTIIEFSDYQCPYCQLFWAQTMPIIIGEYIDKGLVKFVYRDLPLDSHPNAPKAAEATECAGDEGKFWDMHNKIFGSLDEWGGSEDAPSLFKGYAAELDLDEDAFADCLDSGKYTEEVQKDSQEGIEVILGARGDGRYGTPAFFVNGIFLSGPQEFATFQQIIESELETNGASSTITGNCTGKQTS
jgi:protein-disulfide isomerase